MRLWVAALLLFSALVACSIATSTAFACTCLATPLYEADPEDGATEVPLNAAPIIQGVFVAGSVTVEDASGHFAEITVNEGPWPGCAGTWAEIIPKKSWEPRTKYLIRVKPLYPDQTKPEAAQTAFTTGAESLDVLPLSRPTGRMSAITDVPDLGTCGVVHAISCIYVDGQTETSRDVELVARSGDKIVLRSLLPINDVDYGFDVLPDCIELRRRGPTGARSEPLEFCGEGRRVSRWTKPSMRGLWSPVCRDGAISIENVATGQVVRGDGGLDEDGAGGARVAPMGSVAGSSAPAQPRSDDARASQADASLPSTTPADKPAQHRSYGCVTLPGAEDTGGGFVILLLIASACLSRARRSRCFAR